MLKFYDVDEQYVKYLQRIDKQIPNISYTTNNKFICGVVLSVNGFDYYAPISSNTQKQRTSLPILNKSGRTIATIRFCFMFPVLYQYLTEKDFYQVNQQDPKYADLLATEYNYCLANEPRILAKAQSVYAIGCNKDHVLNYTCCNFKLLEQRLNEDIIKVQAESQKQAAAAKDESD